MPIQDLPDHLRTDLRAPLTGPLGRVGDELALKGQQLRGRVAINAQAPVAGHPNRPFLEEPVGHLLNLSECFLG